MSIFAVVKQYHQSASAHSDMIIKDDASSHKEAVECAFNYLIENDNRANELGDYELKTILFNEMALILAITALLSIVLMIFYLVTNQTKI